MPQFTICRHGLAPDVTFRSEKNTYPPREPQRGIFLDPTGIDGRVYRRISAYIGVYWRILAYHVYHVIIHTCVNAHGGR